VSAALLAKLSADLTRVEGVDTPAGDRLGLVALASAPMLAAVPRTLYPLSPTRSLARYQKVPAASPSVVPAASPSVVPAASPSVVPAASPSASVVSIAPPAARYQVPAASPSASASASVVSIAPPAAAAPSPHPYVTRLPAECDGVVGSGGTPLLACNHKRHSLAPTCGEVLADG
jgi:hypothetical protein